MTDVVVVEQDGQTVVVLTEPAPQVVQVAAPGPQGIQGIPGVVPATTAEFDGGTANIVFTTGPSLDLGSAA